MREWPPRNEILVCTVIISFLLPTSRITDSSESVFSYGVTSVGKIQMGWLQTNGKQITNYFGNEFMLHGANFMGYEFGSWNSHTEKDYEKMSSWGFNVVRLPIAWQYIEPQPGVYNLDYFDKHVDEDLQWAEANAMYIILDMHQWYWSSTFSFDGCTGLGFPAWAYSTYPNTKEGYQKAVTDFWLDKGPNGTEASVTNPSMKSRYVTLWKKVASRYANVSVIAGYDLLNEPLSGPYMPPPQLTSSLSFQSISDLYYSFHAKLVSEIRQVDNKHIVFYELFGPFISENSVPLQSKRVNDSNIVASFHFYHFRSEYAGNYAWLREMFETWWWSSLESFDIPIWVGEFGAFTEEQNSTIWLKDTLSIFKQHNLGWAWWAYWKSDTYTSALLYLDGNERTEWLQYLIAP